MYLQIPNYRTVLWTNIYNVLNLFGEIQDRLDPVKIEAYANRLKPLSELLTKTIDETDLKANHGNNSLDLVLYQVGKQLLIACERFESARFGPHEIMKAYQSLRPVARAEEILYSLSTEFEEISRYFLHPTQKENKKLLEKFLDLKANDNIEGRKNADSEAVKLGIIDVNNNRSKRGGYTLYIPEYYSVDRSYPLVVALHGGSGHGGDFFWSWLRDVRSFGFILASPTSLGRTWSMQSPAIDASGLNQMLSDISANWKIDTKHILLTGLSDGGTYSMRLSIVHQSPFTHYAPVASAAHILLNREGAVTAPVKDLPIYQVHGARDWMFPVEKARAVSVALEKAGAKIKYRELSDLSHNYPRDENEAILKWFCPEAFDFLLT